MPKQRIEELWTTYRMNYVHIQASPGQIKEMKRAFYAGAQALFTTMLVSLTPGGEAEDVDINMMTELHNELVDFAIAVKRGQA